MGERQTKAVKVAEFLADHDGVISTDQAKSLGMSHDEVYGKSTAGLWIRHANSTFLSAEHRMTDIALVRTAALAHGGVIDRTSAVWLHGLTDELPTPITLSVPRTAHGAACAVDTQVRRRTFPAEDIATVRGITVTARPLTVLLGSSALRDGIDMMDAALLRRLVTLRQLRAAADRNSGVYGMAKARKLLASAEDLSESELERKFVRFLRRHKIDGWLQQQYVGGHRIDFVWPEERIAVQLHGWAFHHAHAQWERDQEITNMLVNIGWLPLIFTWKRLEFAPDEVLRELCTAIELRRNVG
ncbi:DUF559 domain-containing protein [Gordonia sp. HY442]|uniref:DUF559 domain-containing protein n=1 Tax=Gordonia zhenghanii TaxID=2911516 RepID=UPI001F3A0616|nr:DUF559 domain-containing protein [Gordonia zhenghanii]MCF8601943.1 DUF559 domain-containing protein [Gordonia zhenghanii]MCF8602011.1 DUF559 domain-containing protein [Gordonia zhenghanii]